MESVMQNELKDSKKSGTKHHYNNLLPHLIFNYIAFKTGEDGFQKLLDKIFRDKIGIKYDISFAAATSLLTKYSDVTPPGKPTRFRSSSPSSTN